MTSDLRSYNLSAQGAHGCVPLWSWPSSEEQQLTSCWAQAAECPTLARKQQCHQGTGVWGQAAPGSAPWAIWMRLTFPSGDSFPVVLDFCQLPTSSYAYLQLAGNVSCHMDGKHVNCVAAKMSKKIKIFFFSCCKSRALFSASQHPGRIVWVGFFFPFIFTIYLSFLVFYVCHHSTSEKLGILHSRF